MMRSIVAVIIRTTLHKRKEINKMKKKTLSLLLVIALSVSLCIGASATDSSRVQAQQKKLQLEAGLVVNLKDKTVTLNNAESWANKDYSKATNTEKVNILKARSIMMQKRDWVADGYKGTYTAPDGTAKELPKFSTVFPGWDKNQIDAYDNAVYALEKQAVMSSALAMVPTAVYPSDFTFSHSIPVATGTNAPEAVQRTMVEGVNSMAEYKTTVNSLTTCTTCNIGYNVHTSYGSVIDAGNATYLSVGGHIDIDLGTDTSSTLGIRLSTFSSAGYGNFTLHIGDPIY
jgi:hypothetical protein